ncbi:DUF829 domain-containing protein [Campylobacter sp. TTU_617]|uniref:DUF829 domain-containing protein n=1 Tax=Campylobacter sp. TTU_617 TaxID=2768148 RepID=UPI001903552F|nr:DUF829 domain-containing protein [Campylobacter sp. TTU_617]MBK1972312.1 DUF829 domain-containing protein [Campylobacter sp. TTU_617]
MQRDVFYLAGYDPRTYRYYYSLFKKNLNLYKNRFNIDAQLSKSFTQDNIYWNIEGKNYQTKYHFLAWNDIVKTNWSESFKDALLDCYSFFRIYTITGLFIKFGKASIYQLITGYYPFFYVIFSLCLALICSSAVFLSAKIYIHFIFAAFFSVIAFYMVNRFLFNYGRKLAVFWISRICSFCANWHKFKKGQLENRIEKFSHFIFNTLKQNQNKQDYELILIAHSVGTIMCIEILEQILHLCKEEKIDFSKLKILTLGECIPLVSFQKKSFDFRKKIEFIGDFNLKWYDFTSVIDGACFPQVDFIEESGIKTQFKPKYLSAKFHTLYEKKYYKKIKKNKNDAHFLYLWSVQLRGGYDFFNFITNEKFLEEKIRS